MSVLPRSLSPPFRATCGLEPKARWLIAKASKLTVIRIVRLHRPTGVRR